MFKRIALLAFVIVGTMSLQTSAQWSGATAATIPAFHPAAPAATDKLAPLLKPDELFGDNAQFPYQTHAYELAPKISKVIYQQPCYCYCDRSGHKSLHTCFEGTHGAECSTCLKELYFSYLETKKGKTATQIRAAIVRGDWKQIDLANAAAIR